MKGTVLLPTLGRPHLVKRLLDSYLETESSVAGLLLIDKNDPKLEEYKALVLPEKWFIHLTDSVKMGDKVREAWDIYKDMDFVVILNDDHILRTKGWDQIVLSQLNGTNVVSTNDGATPDKPWNAPHRICGAIAFSGGVFRALGYLFPRKLQHLYSDDVWGQLFSRAQCCNVLMDVCVEHKHAYLNPEDRDDTYRAINGEADFQSKEPKGGLWEHDRNELNEWLKNDLEGDVKKLLQIQPKTGLMVGTPFHDNNCAVPYATGLVDVAMTLNANGIYFELAKVVGSSLITHARNSIVDMFMNSKCQKLLFIDSDQGWDAKTVIPLFKSSRRIIAGITPHKRFPINLNFEPLEEDMKYFKDPINKSMAEFVEFAKARADMNGDIEVARAGTGFMMIDRSVFEIMGDAVPDYLAFDNNNEIKHKEYFIMGGHTGRFRGEDWRFSMLAKELHIPIFINANSIVPHLGNFLFSAV